jgi:AcrR family transcriptional regulator
MQTPKKSAVKEKILATSIELFNDSSSLQITTNHIAKACGISVGNLYYHYDNKEQIIREIYANMTVHFESLDMYERIKRSPNPIDELRSIFEELGEFFFAFRFMMRDGVILMAMDSQLKTMFAHNQSKRIAQIENLLHFFVEREIIIPMSDEEIRLRAKHQWFVSTYWHIFSSVDGDITKASIQEAKDVVFKLLIEPILIK